MKCFVLRDSLLTSAFSILLCCLRTIKPSAPAAKCLCLCSFETNISCGSRNIDECQRHFSSIHFLGGCQAGSALPHHSSLQGFYAKAFSCKSLECPKSPRDKRDGELNRQDNGWGFYKTSLEWSRSLLLATWEVHWMDTMSFENHLPVMYWSSCILNWLVSPQRQINL